MASFARGSNFADTFVLKSGKYYCDFGEILD